MRSVKFAKSGYVTVSVALILAGLLLLIHPQVSAVMFCKVSGVILLLCGGIKIYGYLVKDLYRLAFQFDLAMGALVFALGLIMLLRTDGFLRFFNLLIGIVVLADGLFKIQTAVDAKRFGLGKWWLIAIMAAVTSILGLCVVLDPIGDAGIVGLTAISGAVLVMEGLLNLCVALCAVKTTGERRQTIDYYD